MRFVEIVWEDPASYDEWTLASDVETTMIVTSCGYLFKETTRHAYLTLNQYVDDNELHVSCSMVIPKSLIKSVRYLRYAKG